MIDITKKKNYTLLKRYFDDNSLIKSSIESFNYFIEHELQQIIEENKEVEPTIIPENIEEFKIRFDKIWLEKPQIIEADGSKRSILPIEARIRKLSYAAPVHLEISAHINGIQRESFDVMVCNLPIMLKSRRCNLYNMSREELIKAGEDPDELGGYFIINGTEKILISVEDLAPNRFIVEKESTGVSEYVGKIFSEKGSYKIPHKIEEMKDGILYITFTRLKRIPIIPIIKALGLVKDKEIFDAIGLVNSAEVMINLYEFESIKTQEDAIDWLSKKIGINQTREIRIERTLEILDKYLLPHIGLDADVRYLKAHNLAKYVAKFIRISNKEIEEDDKDHYSNKRIKLAGDLIADLFRMNMKVLIGDILYNFQRIVKRGKFPSIKVLVRDKILTQKIYGAMATGNWIGGRTGISQRIERLNFMQTLSHLQRVVSPLAATQENFEARALHPTHLGRLCPSETPEGTNIGLRKNLALLAKTTSMIDEAALMSELKKLGLKTIK